MNENIGISLFMVGMTSLLTVCFTLRGPVFKPYEESGISFEDSLKTPKDIHVSDIKTGEILARPSGLWNVKNPDSYGLPVKNFKIPAHAHID